MDRRILLLRIIHGAFAAYFALCLVYLYYALFQSRYDLLLVISIVSLGIEGILVYGFNRGDCPLIHVQRRIGDDIPFFELFLPRRFARHAIPVFAVFVLIAVGVLLWRYVVLCV